MTSLSSSLTSFVYVSWDFLVLPTMRNIILLFFYNNYCGPLPQPDRPAFKRFCSSLFKNKISNPEDRYSDSNSPLQSRVEQMYSFYVAS